MQEYIPLGQRVSSFRVKYWNNKEGDWTEFAQATTIGYKRILRFPWIATRKIKIEFDALACPLISKVSIYNAPEQFSVSENVSAGNKTVRSTSKWKLTVPEADLSKITDGDNNTYLEINKIYL
ncbi:hypothetical protein [Dysgonomonas sp. 521]|uniref:hypothetical protein n=1 Tax=Dysgonomonas sp. 521 TaxID=2302932 RepID=UPI0021041E3A|nr:hypothetical protein [Dysgonomonas sp. 521]